MPSHGNPGTLYIGLVEKSSNVGHVAEDERGNLVAVMSGQVIVKELPYPRGSSCISQFISYQAHSFLLRAS